MNFLDARKLAIGLLLVAALALVVPASAQQTTETPSPDAVHTLSVSGEGVAYGTPDTAYVELGVQTTDPDLSTAFSKTGQSITNVLKSLKDLGIADQDIQTTGVNVNPQNQYDNNGNPSPNVTYTVSNTVQVTVRKIDQVESVLTSAIAAGANSINNLSFGIQDTSKLEAQARTDAVKQAQSRAQQLATALGVTVGKPITVSEVPNVSAPVPVFKAAALMSAASPGQPVSQGQLSVTVDVQITFTIS